jgi:hypothetical protein
VSKTHLLIGHVLIVNYCKIQATITFDKQLRAQDNSNYSLIKLDEFNGFAMNKSYDSPSVAAPLPRYFEVTGICAR